MSGASVTLSGVGKAYNGVSVLAGVDLAIAPGGFLTIIGRSGSGKSTLLRLINALETPSQGAVAVEAGAAARMMFQEPRLLPWAKVGENVEVGLGPVRRSRETRARAQAALQEVGLGDRAEAWPGALSGGQKQRVALARALVSRPTLLTLDEPLGALDALTRIEMQALIERVWRAQGFTAVLVTHDVGEAVTLGDRVILIEGGGVGLDLAIDLPRPRRRGDPRFAALEGLLLERLMGQPGS